MKIVLTGSLGHISKPLASQLVKEGHIVTVISSSEERKKEIAKLGAEPAIGKVEDRDFLIKVFENQDAAYCMLPPFDFFGDKNLDYKKEALNIASNYAFAIQKSGIKKVVHLSSVGAEKSAGTGLLVFHNIVESVLRNLPDDISITHIRPVSFYYNLYAFSDMIKGNGFLKGFIGKLFYLRHYGIKGLLKGYSGIILSNYGAKDKIAWVSTIDIAQTISEELISKDQERKVRYVTSEELTCQEVASIIGNRIGKPYLKWVLISNKQMTSAIEQIGASKEIAKELTEMNITIHNGSLFEHYNKNKPKLGEIKMTDFAKEFALNF
ncbi:NmrA family NAD(P)-binding protein [Fulvivirga sediminis]|uniref:NAD(P)H-binding protein n=1 Tax=Fulvivirga sediminis TaxID=2803949 RepID=A0A937FB90_9BACT|nr:NAD(P)H-binding protein [Fulvivirga sediminis]MBL3657403.1 NAD(P)H-binding protein [Fulvivirga sediminis]